MKIEFKPKKVENFPYDKYVFQKYENNAPTNTYIGWIERVHSAYPDGKIVTLSGSNADQITMGYCGTIEECEMQCNWINEKIKNKTLG